jgi:hypothetical protein
VQPLCVQRLLVARPRRMANPPRSTTFTTTTARTPPTAQPVHRQFARTAPPSPRCTTRTNTTTAARPITLRCPRFGAAHPQPVASTEPLDMPGDKVPQPPQVLLVVGIDPQSQRARYGPQGDPAPGKADVPVGVGPFDSRLFRHGPHATERLRATRVGVGSVAEVASPVGEVRPDRRRGRATRGRTAGGAEALVPSCRAGEGVEGAGLVEQLARVRTARALKLRTVVV